MTIKFPLNSVINLKDQDVSSELIHIDATSMNSMFTYLKKKAIDFKDVKEIHFQGSKASLEKKVGWATVMARHFDALIHFSHQGIPVTAYPDTRSAALADYERRGAAGERVDQEEDDDD